MPRRGINVQTKKGLQPLPFQPWQLDVLREMDVEMRGLGDHFLANTRWG